MAATAGMVDVPTFDPYDALLAAIEEHGRLPFQYGVSDCFILMMDAARALTGEDPYAGERTYKTENGAMLRLKKRGFASVEDAIAAVYERVPHSLAKRGDLAICLGEDDPIVGGVIMGSDVWGKGEQGLVRVKLSSEMRCYSVRKK